MQKEADRQKFTFFRHKGEQDLYVAVPHAYSKYIEAAREQYGSISAVPNMKTVRGIFVKRSDDGYRFVDRNMQENDITINQLEPAE